MPNLMPEISFLQILADMANPQLAFLPRALLAAVIAALLCAVVGCFVVLRGMAFIGDAVAHAVFPGIAVAFALQTSVLLGGAVAGALVAVLIAVMSQRRTIKEDSVIGIVFTAAFAVGLVIISRVEGYTGSVSSFLFGSLTGVSTRDLLINAVVGALIVGVVIVLRPWFSAVALDRETARAMSLPVAALDLALYLAVTFAVVLAVQTVGNILVVALLITPAAAARMFTDRLETMMIIAAAIGATGSLLGVWLAWAYDSPTGATIVLSVTVLFALSWLFAPRRGVLAKAVHP